jgi:hypothetical protein
MAAPTVRGWSTATNSTDAQPAVSIALPTVVAGDLLLAFQGCDTLTSPGAATGSWELIFELSQGTGTRAGVWGRIATNEDSDALSLAGSNNNDMTVVVAAITVGTHGCTAGTLATDIIRPAQATGSSTTPDPPASGTVAAKDWLAIAMTVVDLTGTGSTISAAPTNYTTGAQLQKSASSTTSVGLGVGYRALSAATSEDPGTFTCTTGQWQAITMLVPPYVAPSPPVYPVMATRVPS